MIGNQPGIRPVYSSVDAEAETYEDAERVVEEDERDEAERAVDGAEGAGETIHGSGDEEESPEVRKVRFKRSPKAPTRADYKQHFKMAHLSFRST